jgi:hypothetical protein
MAAARGWLARGARIIEAEAPQLRGELLGATSFVSDDPVRSERLARQALEIGRADGNAELELLAMTAIGGALVQQGRTAEGLAVLDEAMAAALAGECSDPLTVAHTSCMTMLVCSSHFDIERATQWVQGMNRFIERYGCPFLDAECRTNYGRVLFENGDHHGRRRRHQRTPGPGRAPPPAAPRRPFHCQGERWSPRRDSPLPRPPAPVGASAAEPDNRTQLATWACEQFAPRDSD